MENKYLKLIEQITCIIGDEDEKEKAKRFDTIYVISHIANGKCKNPHKDWVEEVEKLIIEFKDI